MNVLLVLMIALLLASPAAACSSPPGSFDRSVSELVRSALWIALARFESREEDSMLWLFPPSESDESFGMFMKWHHVFSSYEEYRESCSRIEVDRFSLMESLKGTPDEPLALRLPVLRSSIESTFSDHADWIDSASASGRVVPPSPPNWGRVQPTVDCQLYPDFEEGATYLVFDAGEHPLAYERVDDPETDVWLDLVRRTIELQSALRFRPARHARGSVNENRVPLSTSLSTRISPCIERTRCFTIESPSPVLPRARERAASTR